MLAVSSGRHTFSHQLLIDELLSVLLLSSLYLLWKAVTFRKSAWRWIAFYAVVGLAVLAKGLPGVVFPGLALAAFILVRSDWKLIRQCRPMLGIAVVALIVAPWAWLFESHN